MISRRKFVTRLALVSGSIQTFSTALASPKAIAGPAKSPPFNRFTAVLEQVLPIPLPPGKRVPLGKTAFPVSAQKPVRLMFPELKDGKGIYVFRLTAALDFREEKSVQVTVGDTGPSIGVFDIRYAHPFQPFEIPIDSQWIPRIRLQGLSLTLTKGNTEAWFLAPGPAMSQFLAVQPQLMVCMKAGTEREFMANLYSMNAFSPFGWLGGCVLDGLYELEQVGDITAGVALDNQLNVFLDDRKGIVYENSMTVPIDGSFNSIEDFLPFACIVNRFPAHTSVAKATEFLLARKNVSGLIMSGNDVTTEGCYTVAYPLAAIAKRTQDAQLARVALDQLTHRMRLLTGERAIYQRSTLHGAKAFRNWGRGIAWYLLGTVKTLRLLHEAGFGNMEGLNEVRDSFRTNLTWLMELQTKDGLWYSYVDQPDTQIDTSATAGIAAAIGWGCLLGIVPVTMLSKAQRAYEGLQGYLTADGFLTNVSQINRGGEALQRNGFRVMAQFGVGLLGQLKAVLVRNSRLAK